MEINDKNLLGLIKSAITKERIEFCSPIDWEYIYNVAVRHNIFALLFCGIQYSSVNENNEYFLKINEDAMKAVRNAYVQKVEIQKLFEVLDKNKIDYLPVKGAVIKDIYPENHIRFMSDIDILIKESQYPKIEEVMKSNEYIYKYDSNHEIVWETQNKLPIELHKHLIPTYNDDYYEYFEQEWERAINDDNSTRYHLSNDDLFIYAFVHMTKHFRDGGVGINHIVDLWVMSKNCQLDLKYIKKEVNLLGLGEFLDNILELINYWFENGIENEKMQFMTDWILSGGSYGTFENRAIAQGLAKKAENNGKRVKYKLVMNVIFPNMTIMSHIYPTLNKHSYLLPIFWIYRLFSSAFFKSNRVKKNYEALKCQTEENIVEYEKNLSYLGLNFDLEKKD